MIPLRDARAPQESAMSSRKKRKGQRPGRQPVGRQPQGRKSRFNATYLFVAVIVLGLVAVAVANALSGGPPVECPPGQVWSDAHDHCH
jgi:hypothetical protein